MVWRSVPLTRLHSDEFLVPPLLLLAGLAEEAAALTDGPAARGGPGSSNSLSSSWVQTERAEHCCLTVMPCCVQSKSNTSSLVEFGIAES